jgi:hypothetical protein
LGADERRFLGSRDKFCFENSHKPVILSKGFFFFLRPSALICVP